MGPSGQVTGRDIRNELAKLRASGDSRFVPNAKALEMERQYENAFTEEQRDQAYQGYANLYNENSAVSDRTKREAFEKRFSLYNIYEKGNWGPALDNELSKTLKDANEQISSSTGSEFSRVLRQKYLQTAAASPGRRATILTGRS